MSLEGVEWLAGRRLRVYVYHCSGTFYREGVEIKHIQSFIRSSRRLVRGIDYDELLRVAKKDEPETDKLVISSLSYLGCQWFAKP